MCAARRSFVAGRADRTSGGAWAGYMQPLPLYESVIEDFLPGTKAKVAHAAMDPVVLNTKDRPIAKGVRAVMGLRWQYQPADGAGQVEGRVMVAERLGSETVADLVLRSGTHLIAIFSEDRVCPRTRLWPCSLNRRSTCLPGRALVPACRKHGQRSNKPPRVAMTRAESNCP